jgi:hypothetical protein
LKSVRLIPFGRCPDRNCAVAPILKLACSDDLTIESVQEKLKTVFLQKVRASAGEIYRTAVQHSICGELKNSFNDPKMIMDSFEMRQ